MRTVQISIHAECFNDQVPKDWPDKRQSMHVYCDARNFSEALLGAVCEIVKRRGEHLGARLDSVTNADESELDRNLASMLEPARIVDYRDGKAIVEQVDKDAVRQILENFLAPNSGENQEEEGSC